jgi:hypothetical protein
VSSSYPDQYYPYIGETMVLSQGKPLQALIARSGGTRQLSSVHPRLISVRDFGRLKFYLSLSAVGRGQKLHQA